MPAPETPLEIYAALEARRLELGLSQAEVGTRAFGKPDNSAFQALRRGSAPAADKLAALCRAVEWEFYYGPPRDIAPIQTVPVGGEYAYVPLHAATLSAGDGAFNSDETVIDYLAFKRTWLRRIGVSPANAVLAHIADGNVGRSMIPTIYPKDLVLMDTSRRQIPQHPQPSLKDAPIFAFTTEHGARVKRVSIVQDTIVLSSDNADFPPELIPQDAWEEINVIGEVMWWARTAKG